MVYELTVYPCLHTPVSYHLVVSLLYVVLIPFANAAHNTFSFPHLDTPVWLILASLQNPHLAPLQVICFYLLLQYPSFIVTLVSMSNVMTCSPLTRESR